MITLYVSRLQPDDSHQVIAIDADGRTSIRGDLTAAHIRSAVAPLRPGIDYRPHPHPRNILADVLATS